MNTQICRIVGAIALPVTKEDKKKRKYQQKPLKTPLGPIIISAYNKRSKKTNGK